MFLLKVSCGLCFFVARDSRFIHTGSLLEENVSSRKLLRYLFVPGYEYLFPHSSKTTVLKKQSLRECSSQ